MRNNFPALQGGVGKWNSSLHPAILIIAGSFFLLFLPNEIYQDLVENGKTKGMSLTGYLSNFSLPAGLSLLITGFIQHRKLRLALLAIVFIMLALLEFFPYPNGPDYFDPADFAVEFFGLLTGYFLTVLLVRRKSAGK